MANLYSSDLGGNSRKAQPSSTFGTRNLQFLVFSMNTYNLFTDNSMEGSYADPNSLYSQVVNQIQRVAEIYYLGQPTSIHANGSFVFAIADDTATWYYSENTNDFPEQDPSEGFNVQLNTLVDRLRQFFNTNSDNLWNLAPLVDTGFGLLPGESLSYLQN